MKYSEYFEWWYKYLEPNVHFIPLKKDISDLVEKLKWAKENDDQAKKIAEAGSMLARNLVMGNTLYCAYAKAFEIYRYKTFSSLNNYSGLKKLNFTNFQIIQQTTKSTGRSLR